MDYELCKQLKDMGFPYKPIPREPIWNPSPPEGLHEAVVAPTLSELISACGEGFSSLTRSPRNTWYVASPRGEGKNEYELVVGDECSTPEEAVARLWLALHPVKEV